MTTASPLMGSEPLLSDPRFCRSMRTFRKLRKMCQHPDDDLFVNDLFVIFKEALHIFGDMLAKDVFLVDFSVVLFALGVKSGESPVAVGDVDASVNGAL